MQKLKLMLPYFKCNIWQSVKHYQMFKWVKPNDGKTGDETNKRNRTAQELH